MRPSLPELLHQCADGRYCQSASFLRCSQRHPALLEAPLHLLTAGRIESLTDAVAKQLTSDDCVSVGKDPNGATDLVELLVYIHLFSPRSSAPSTSELDRLDSELLRLRAVTDAAVKAGAAVDSVTALRYAIRESLLYLGLNGRPMCKLQWRSDAPAGSPDDESAAASLIAEQEARFRQLRRAANAPAADLQPHQARFWGDSADEADIDKESAVEQEFDGASAPAPMSAKKIIRLARRLGRRSPPADAADLADFCRSSLLLLSAPSRQLRSSLADGEISAGWRRVLDRSITRALPLILSASSADLALEAELACLELWRRLLDRRRCPTDGWFGVPALQCALQCLLCLPPWSSQTSTADWQAVNRLPLISAASRFVVKAISRFRDYLYASPAAPLAVLSRLIVAFVDLVDCAPTPPAEDLRRCLSELSKAAQAFCSGEHRKLLAKTAWPLLAAYANRLHLASAIDTRWRQELDSAVAAPFLAVTDRHAHAHLRVGLKPGPREILRNLHATYLKYYKFHGDV